jgi:outer membrane receptor protein involved in Fe transport
MDALRRLCLTAFVISACSIPSLAAAPQSAFTGRVVDQRSQQPIAGATVILSGYPGTARTDADGRFSIAPRPALPFQVIIVLPGGHVARPVDIDRIEENGHTITVDALASESLTVVGAAPSVAVSPAAGTTLLSAVQIARRNPENLMQAVETVPGINQVSEGHASAPAIRGMARGRTLLLIDGGRVSSERRAGPSATFADPAVVEGIDVARGPGSVAYGSDALGGVISIRTRRAEPGSPFRVRGTATLGGGIPDRRGTIELSKGLRAGGILVQGHLRDADDWDSPEDAGDVFNSGWEDQGFLARIDHQVGAGVLSASWQSDFGRDIERPRNNSRTVRFYYPYENSHRFTSGYELSNVAGLQQATFTAFVGTFEQRTDQDRFPTATSVRSIERADIEANDFHVKGSGVKSVGVARLEFGLDVNGRYGLEALDVNVGYDGTGNVANEDVNVSVDSARRTDLGAYLQADGPISRTIRLSGGIRGDNVTTRNEGGFFGDRSTSNGAFAGFGAVTAGPYAGVSFTGQVSRGFRDPTLSDRYFRGPSGRGFITGNPDLEPEKSLQYDVAARYALARTQLAVYFYHYRIADLVERFEAEPDFFFFRNRGRARLRGFEVETRTDLGGGFAVEVGGHVGRGVALDDDAALDDISPDTLSLLLRKDFGRRGYAQVRSAFLAKDDRPGPAEVEAPGATVVDLSAGWTLTSNLELRGGVRNLLDASYFASPDPRWVFAPGRSASLTLSVSY